MSERAALEARWLELTKATMPALADERDWPVRFDHCFQRILLDNAAEGCWRDTIPPPAYRNAPPDLLERAVALGEAVVKGDADLHNLNRRSLESRGKCQRPG